MPKSHYFSRRALLIGAGATVSAAALTTAVVPLQAAAPATPEYEDLTRYYAFLWCEFSALSKELGVDQHDSLTAHRNGDVEAVDGALTSLPSTRALAVMSGLGVDRGTVPSTTALRHATSRPTAEEDAHNKLRLAAKEMRLAMCALGHRDFTVSIKPNHGFGFTNSVTFAADGLSYDFA